MLKEKAENESRVRGKQEQNSSDKNNRKKPEEKTVKQQENSKNLKKNQTEQQRSSIKYKKKWRKKCGCQEHEASSNECAACLGFIYLETGAVVCEWIKCSDADYNVCMHIDCLKKYNDDFVGSVKQKYIPPSIPLL